EALGTTDLNGGALFNAEFGIRHRGSTVPERSGVALSFCRRHGRKMARRVRAGMFVGSCGSFSGKCYLLFGGVRLLRLRSVTGATTPERNSISGYIRDLMPRLYF
ncbi:hypothetical protein, partial [Pseudomonas aeruginosa]|uniref:hypothetical protein n=1 Tax=Pseudomonas aeruginosa TaxID=287 RepID=UPI001C529745